MWPHHRLDLSFKRLDLKLRSDSNYPKSGHFTSPNERYKGVDRKLSIIKKPKIQV